MTGGGDVVISFTVCLQQKRSTAFHLFQFCSGFAYFSVAFVKYVLCKKLYWLLNVHFGMDLWTV